MNQIIHMSMMAESNEENRIESLYPKAYRLMQKENGELVLQGAFYWSHGNSGGVEWRVIETVKEIKS